MNKILLLEDNPTDADLVSMAIRNHWPNVELKVVSRIKDAKKQLQTDYNFDIAIFDLNLPDGNGMDLLGELRAEQCEIPIIILTGEGSEEIAITALKTGANDFISKKVNYHEQIPAQIEFTLKHTIASRKHLSILYVEHHKSDIDLTERYFKKSAPHIHISTVSTGEELLKLLPEDNTTACEFDVVLLDYRLPGLNALEISKVIRHERNLTVAMVIVTGQGDEKIVVEALKIGVDDYLVKHKNYLLRMPSVLMSAYRRRELERQKLEIQKSETKYRLLADYAADWEYWIGANGDYVYISPVCEETSGYTPEAFMRNSKLMTEITHPDFRAAITKHYEEEIARIHKPIEFKIITASGEEKWISHFCRPVYDEKNTYMGKRGVNRDITERKKAELDLLAALKRATESDRLKTAFLANMSHEIRTPMNGILGFSNLLENPELSIDKQQKYLRIIQKNGKRMITTINDLVNISKIEAGQMKVHISEVNLCDTFEELYTFFKPEADIKALQFSLHNSLSKENCIINSDPAKIYSILSNLIKNAIKFSKEGSIEFGASTGSATKLPTLESSKLPDTESTKAPDTESTKAPDTEPTKAPVTEPVEAPDTEPTKAPVAELVEAPVTEPTKAPVTELVEVPVTEPAEITFYVKDTGIGIPLGRQEFIFDRFVQADIEDKAAHEGSGLGLSISKAYVEMLGGKIWLESVEGKGSVLYFTIPI